MEDYFSKSSIDKTVSDGKWDEAKRAVERVLGTPDEIIQDPKRISTEPTTLVWETGDSEIRLSNTYKGVNPKNVSQTPNWSLIGSVKYPQKVHRARTLTEWLDDIRLGG